MQTVTGQLKQALVSLGMADQAGVVNSAFDMVKAYAAIYNRMKEDAARTTTDLNNAYAKMLTARD
jgi:hypothetical protein